MSLLPRPRQTLKRHAAGTKKGPSGPFAIWGWLVGSPHRSEGDLTASHFLKLLRAEIFYCFYPLVFFQTSPHLGFKLTSICFRPYGRRRGEIMKTTIELPLLPLRDVVVYPHMVIPLFVWGARNPSKPSKLR